MRKKREKCVKMHIEGISSQFRLVTLIVTLFRQYFIDSFFFNKWYFIIYFSSFFLKLEKKKTRSVSIFFKIH